MAMVKGGAVAAIPGMGVGVDSNFTDSRSYFTLNYICDDKSGFTARPRFICTEDQKVSAFLLTSLGVLGVTANIILIIVICFKGSFKR